MKRINMMLNDNETQKLEDIKTYIGLKTTTDTIRYLISSVYMKFMQDNQPKPSFSPYGTPNPYPTQPGPGYGIPFTPTPR